MQYRVFVNEIYVVDYLVTANDASHALRLVVETRGARGIYRKNMNVSSIERRELVGLSDSSEWRVVEFDPEGELREGLATYDA